MHASRIASIIVVLFVVGEVSGQTQGDRSLPTKTYVEHGVPSPAKPWSDRDFQTGARGIETRGQIQPGTIASFGQPEFGRFV